MTYRHHLPQLDGGLFLTDGGIETTLIFHDGLDLPLFAAFDLLKDDEGTEALRRYFAPYAALAAERGAGFVLESPTWRASPRWASEIGYSEAELDELNRKAIVLMGEIRERPTSPEAPIVISGCVGPQGDGYNPAELLSAAAAQDYHSTQIGTFSATAADMVTAIAIEQVDDDTDGGPAYYMINCAHPTHFDGVIAGAGTWGERIRGLRANASTKSHAELDEATELEPGDPVDLGARYAALATTLPNLNVLGGCCGTDHRHLRAISHAWPAGSTGGR